MIFLAISKSTQSVHPWSLPVTIENSLMKKAIVCKGPGLPHGHTHTFSALLTGPVDKRHYSKDQVPVRSSSALADLMVIYNLWGFDATAELISQVCLARLRPLVLTGWQRSTLNLWWFFSAALCFKATVFIHAWMGWCFYGVCLCTGILMCLLVMVFPWIGKMLSPGQTWGLKTWFLKIWIYLVPFALSWLQDSKSVLVIHS